MNEHNPISIIDPITANKASKISLNAFLSKNAATYNTIMNEINDRAENGERSLKLRHIEDLKCQDFLVGEGRRFINFLKELGYTVIDGRSLEDGIYLTIEWYYR